LHRALPVTVFAATESLTLLLDQDRFRSLATVDQAQARAILYIKAEIVRLRSYGQPHRYKFWKFGVDETAVRIWQYSDAHDVVVSLSTDYGLLDGSGYRDRRIFQIDKGGRVALMQVQRHDGSVVEGRKSGRLATGVYRSVLWPG
jgi:hypothetical protein